MPHQEITSAPQTDGRLKRSTKTRAAIVDALIALVGDGNLVPTSEEVAEKANVGLRTVFRHFEDMEKLYEEVNEAIQTRIVQPEFDLAATEGDLETRVRTLMQRRGALFARIQPFVASNIARKWRSPFLQRAHKVFTELQTTYLVDSLPEIKNVDLPIQRAIDQLGSFDAWNRMRNNQEYSQKAIEAVQVETILALLKAK